MGSINIGWGKDDHAIIIIVIIIIVSFAYLCCLCRNFRATTSRRSVAAPMRSAHTADIDNKLHTFVFVYATQWANACHCILVCVRARGSHIVGQRHNEAIARRKKYQLSNDSVEFPYFSQACAHTRTHVLYVMSLIITRLEVRYKLSPPNDK